MKLLSDREYELLNREIAYWRDLFEKEQKRADTAVDQLLELSGRPPVSAPALAERAEQKTRVEKFREGLTEVFLEESELEATEEAKESLKIAAEEFARKHDSASVPV